MVNVHVRSAHFLLNSIIEINSMFWEYFSEENVFFLCVLDMFNLRNYHNEWAYKPWNGGIFVYIHERANKNISQLDWNFIKKPKSSM